MHWVAVGVCSCLPRRSLLTIVLGAVNCASVALSHATLVHLLAVLESWALAAVARVSHHVLAKHTSLLDSCLKVLVRLLLDCLCVL